MIFYSKNKIRDIEFVKRIDKESFAYYHYIDRLKQKKVKVRNDNYYSQW